MKLYKLKILLPITLIVFLFVSMQKKKHNTIIGKWNAIEAYNEVGVSCGMDFPKTNSLTMIFNSDSTYEALMKNEKGERRDFGNYIIVKNKTGHFLRFFNVQVDLPYMRHSQKMEDSDYPIIKFTRDSLILRHNLCCQKDTCDRNSGTIVFVKEKTK